MVLGFIGAGIAFGGLGRNHFHQQVFKERRRRDPWLVIGLARGKKNSHSVHGGMPLRTMPGAVWAADTADGLESSISDSETKKQELEQKNAELSQAGGSEAKRGG